MFKDRVLLKMALEASYKRGVEGGEGHKEVCANGFQDSLLS